MRKLKSDVTGCQNAVKGVIEQIEHEWKGLFPDWMFAELLFKTLSEKGQRMSNGMNSLKSFQCPPDVNATVVVNQDLIMSARYFPSSACPEKAECASGGISSHGWGICFYDSGRSDNANASYQS
jgi:hypothetical protein